MTKNENLRLCGGTFFTLLLEARKQLLGANEHYAGKKDGLTEYETLIGLARVIRSDLATPMPTEIKTIQGNASEYKKCKNAGGGYFPFGDKTALRVFDERVKNEYVDTLRKMCRFVDDFIDAGGDIKKDELLVKALVELISLDNCIDDSQSFYIKEDGTTAQKKELINMKEIPLQSFLLGIFHYSVCSVDNVVGTETFDFWCPSAGGAKRTYKGDIGADWPVDIKLRYIQLEDCDIAENDANGSPEDVIVEADCEDPHQNKEKSKQQMVFNFNVTGNNNSFRAITESTSKELKAAYAALPEDAISVLKTYPAIIATENHTYGKTDEDHYAAYGLIVDVKIQDNGIKVYYQILNWIPQQKINELRFELGIEGCSGTNELNRMHWAIKKINAVEVLREAGIQVFSL